MLRGLGRRSLRLYLLLVLETAVYGLVLTIFGATLPRIIRQFSWSYVAAGAVLAAGSAGFFVATLATGYLLRRFRTKALLLAGTLAAAAGLAAFARSSSPLVNFLCNLAVGLGQGLIEVTVELEVVHLEQRGQSRLMNLLHAVFAAGAIAGPALTLLFLAEARGTGWRLVFPAAAGILALAGLAVAALRFPRDVRAAGAAHEAHGSHGAAALLRREPLLLLLTLLLFLYVGSELGTSNWAAEYFVQVHGTPIPLAGFSVSLLWLGLLIGRLAISLWWHGHRHERLLVGLSLGCSLALPLALAVGSAPLALAFIFLTGVGLSGIYPLVISLAGQHFGTGMAIGIVTTGAGLGSFASPFLMSGLADLVGLRRAFLLFAAANLLMVGLSLAIMQTVDRGQRPAS